MEGVHGPYWLLQFNDLKCCDNLMSIRTIISDLKQKQNDQNVTSPPRPENATPSACGIPGTEDPLAVQEEGGHPDRAEHRSVELPDVLVGVLKPE